MNMDNISNRRDCQRSERKGNIAKKTVLEGSTQNGDGILHDEVYSVCPFVGAWKLFSWDRNIEITDQKLRVCKIVSVRLLFLFSEQFILILPLKPQQPRLVDLSIALDMKGGHQKTRVRAIKL